MGLKKYPLRCSFKATHLGDLLVSLLVLSPMRCVMPDPFDFYSLGQLYSAEALAVRDATRDWVKSEFMPVVRDHFEAGTFPKELIPAMGSMGFFGATLPERYHVIASGMNINFAFLKSSGYCFL